MFTLTPLALASLLIAALVVSLLILTGFTMQVAARLEQLEDTYTERDVYTKREYVIARWTNIAFVVALIACYLLLVALMYPILQALMLGQAG